mmetsp:Transcript_118041/g.341264  ORF Transcript_118041/g.341264 Transcript_118041/m.341264 type:complete len:357 (-) Transcript_118041:728-1798(-)
MSGTVFSRPLYSSCLVTRMSSWKCGMSTVMPGMYGARKGFGMGIPKQRARLLRRHFISMLLGRRGTRRPFVPMLRMPSRLNKSGNFKRLPSLIVSMPSSMTGEQHTETMLVCSLGVPAPSAPAEAAAAALGGRTPKDFPRAVSPVHLSSWCMWSMIRSHMAGKNEEKCSARECRIAPPLAEKVKTFCEKRSGIFEVARSHASLFRCLRMHATPRIVQPAWYHTPVSATNKKKLMDHNSSHKSTSAPQDALRQSCWISVTACRPGVVKSKATVSSRTARKITIDTNIFTHNSTNQNKYRSVRCLQGTDVSLHNLSWLLAGARSWERSPAIETAKWRTRNSSTFIGPSAFEPSGCMSA